jgi:hypothetical protein
LTTKKAVASAPNENWIACKKSVLIPAKVIDMEADIDYVVINFRFWFDTVAVMIFDADLAGV